MTFVDWDDMPRWGLINKTLGLPFPEPVETYSSSPHLFSDLDIPEGTKGRLPRSQRTHAGLGAEEIEDLGETGKRNSGSNDRGGSRGGRDSRSRDGRSGGRDGDRQRSRTRSGSDSGRAARSDDGTSAGPAEAAESKPASRNRRSRTRRRNGEVVGRDGQQGSGSAESPSSAS